MKTTSIILVLSGTNEQKNNLLNEKLLLYKLGGN